MHYSFDRKPELCLLSTILLLGCSLQSISGDSQQVVYEGNKAVVEGDPFEITCYLTEFDPVKWQRDEHTIIPDPQNRYRMQEEKMNGKIVAKLSVEQAEHSHSGSYRCTSFNSVSHQLYVLSANSVQPNYEFENYKTFEYDKSFSLQCNISGTPGMEFNLRWFKEDKIISPGSEKYQFIPKDNKLVIFKANDEDAGNYTCQAVNAKTNMTDNVMKADIKVIGVPKVSLSEDTPVVEGERLRLHCNVRGNPTPNVVWTIDGKPVNTSDGHIRLEDDKEKGIPNAYLVIDEVRMSDRNSYTCKASNIANQENPATEKTTFVRVKDKLAALWPFLGICAEVAVLCTIILIYEKKRNKTELDESDTDQSPEHRSIGVQASQYFSNVGVQTDGPVGPLHASNPRAPFPPSHSLSRKRKTHRTMEKM